MKLAAISTQNPACPPTCRVEALAKPEACKANGETFGPYFFKCQIRMADLRAEISLKF